MDNIGKVSSNKNVFQVAHQLMFSTKSKSHLVKAHVLAFNGLPVVDDPQRADDRERRLTARIGKLKLPVLKELFDLLDVRCSGGVLMHSSDCDVYVGCLGLLHPD